MILVDTLKKALLINSSLLLLHDHQDTDNELKIHQFLRFSAHFLRNTDKIAMHFRLLATDNFEVIFPS